MHSAHSKGNRSRWLIDWLVFKDNFSNISGISSIEADEDPCHGLEQTKNVVDIKMNSWTDVSV